MRGSPHYLSSRRTDADGWVAKCMCGWEADRPVDDPYKMIEVFGDHVEEAEKEEA